MADDSRTFNMSLSTEAHAKPYQCLVEDSSWYDDRTRELAKWLLNQYGNTDQSVTKWRKSGNFNIQWTDRSKPPQKQQSIPLTFEKFLTHLKDHRGIVHQALNIASPEQSQDNWMDADVTWWGHYIPINEVPETLVTQVALNLGPSFPVTPGIDREGFATSSPQLHLQRALLTARARVLKESPLFVPQVMDRDRGEQVQFRMGGTPPLAALIEFVSLYVSILDITLVQAYYAGFYAAGKNLRFNKDLMGPVTGRRIVDKIRWVRALSGRELNAHVELEAFYRMKDVRNHLAHFDPPCFAVSIEDVAEWLSTIPDLAWLLIKIRRCLGVPISGPLVQMAMAPRVVHVPRDPKHKRLKQPATAGYVSSTWKGPHPHGSRDPLRVPERLLGDLDALSHRVTTALGQDCTTRELIEALLVNQLNQMKLLSDQQMAAQIRPIMHKIKS